MSSPAPITETAIAALDRAAALTWRGTEQEPLGDWLLRAAGGFTGRANSALASGDPGMTLPEAAHRIRRWYSSRGLPPMAVVSYPLGQSAGNPMDEFFAAQGWRLRDEAQVIVMTRPAAEPLPAPKTPFPVRFDDVPGDDWLALYHFRGQPDLPPIARTVLTSAPWQAFASAGDGDRTVAIGRVAGAGEWAGLTAIEVDPDYRRRGLAVAVTSALIAHAAGRGTARIYLQVEDGNDPALALYRRLGFTTHHAYHYWVAPAS
ncbi:MAG: GNAT family N-acetyltransferase [Actinobacteria bacterium]|nr:GNAT family N-acetyltransferase [Actinomycetota bacterium]